VSASKLDEQGTELGETPLTLELDQIQGKVIKITENGKQPFFWMVAEAAGDSTEASIKMTNDGSARGVSESKGDSKASFNRVLRIIMKAYQALSNKRFKIARELADQASAIDPEIAAPHIIRGIAFFGEGNMSDAKAALSRAQALDPEDKDVDAILQNVVR